MALSPNADTSSKGESVRFQDRGISFSEDGSSDAQMGRISGQRFPPRMRARRSPNLPASGCSRRASRRWAQDARPRVSRAGLGVAQHETRWHKWADSTRSREGAGRARRKPEFRAADGELALMGGNDRRTPGTPGEICPCRARRGCPPGRGCHKGDSARCGRDGCHQA